MLSYEGGFPVCTRFSGRPIMRKNFRPGERPGPRERPEELEPLSVRRIFFSPFSAFVVHIAHVLFGFVQFCARICQIPDQICEFSIPVLQPVSHLAFCECLSNKNVVSNESNSPPFADPDLSGRVFFNTAIIPTISLVFFNTCREFHL